MRWRLLPAAFFVAATLAAGTDHPVNTPVIGPSWRSVGYATVLPMGNAFLAVWTEAGIRGIRVDVNGVPIDPASFEIAPSTGFLAATAGADAVVAWLSGFGGGTALYRFTRIDAGGNVTQMVTPPLAGVRGIAADDTDILAVSAKGAALNVALLDHDGNVVRADVPVAFAAQAIGDALDVRAAGDAFLIVYTDTADGRLRVVRVTASAIRSGTVSPVADQAGDYQIAWQPRLAVNGDRVLALWNANGMIRARSLSLTGVPTTFAPLSVGSFDAVSSVSPLGDGFLATFFGGDPYSLVVARLTADGEIVSAIRTKFTGEYLVASAAAVGARPVVVWSDHASTTFESPDEVFAAPVLDAAIGAPNVVSLSPAGDQHVHALFATAGGAVAVWSEKGPSERVMVGRFDAAGTPLDGAGFRLRSSIADQNQAAAAFNGQELLVVWSEHTTSWYDGTLYAAVVPLASPASARVVQVTDGVFHDSGPLAAAWNGSEWVVVWQSMKRNLAAMRLARAGDPIDSVAVPLTAVPASPYFADGIPQIAWNGSEYLLVWQRQRGYVPIIGIGEVPIQTVGDVAAQRVTRDLFANGSAMFLALAPGDLSNNPATADAPSLSFAHGLWVTAWASRTSPTRFARIAASGVPLDPLNGRLLPLGSGPHVAPAGDGWIVGSFQFFATIEPNGDYALLDLVSPGIIEAVAFDAPLPMFAYSIPDIDTRAFVHVVTQRRRAIR